MLGGMFSVSAQTVTLSAAGELGTIEDACDINASAASQIASTETERLIRAIYDRASVSDAEIMAWVAGYINPALYNMIDILLIARSQAFTMFMDQEYVDRGRDDTEFIMDMYTILLQRRAIDVSPEEINAWLSGTWTRARAVSDILSSGEYEGILLGSNYYCNPSLRGLPGENLVAQMFLGLVERLPSADELDTWVPLLECPEAPVLASRRGVVIDMVTSLLAEVEAVHGDGTTFSSSDDLAAALYSGLFLRGANQQEISHWSGRIKSGTNTFLEVANEFVVNADGTTGTDGVTLTNAEFTAILEGLEATFVALPDGDKPDCY
jgi:hypothetical protein